MRPAQPDRSPAPADARAEYERFAERMIEKLLGARQVRHLRVEARTLLEGHAGIRREVIDEAMAAWREVRETGDEEDELARAAGQFAAAVWCRAVGGALAGVSDELSVVCLDRMIPAKILSWLENYKNPKVLAALSDIPDKEERVSYVAEKFLDQAGRTPMKSTGFTFQTLGEAIRYWQVAARNALLHTTVPPPTMRGVTIEKIDKVEAPEAIAREEATEADCAADSKRFGRWRMLGEWWHQWAIGGPMPDHPAELFGHLRRDIDFVKFIGLYVLHECGGMTYEQIAGPTRDAPMLLADDLPPDFVPAEIEAELDEWLNEERGEKQRSAEARLKNRVNKISKFSERIYDRLGLHP